MRKINTRLATLVILAGLVVASANTSATAASAAPQLVSTPTHAGTSGASSITVQCPSAILSACSGSQTCAIGVWMIWTTGTGSITPPSGYHLVPHTSIQTALRRTTSLFVHAYNSGDTLQPQFTFSGSGGAEYICAGYSGVDPNVPVNASAGLSDGSSMSLTSPSVNSTTNYGSLLMLYAADYSGTFSSPSAGYLDATDQNNGRSLAWVDALPVATGATGEQSIGISTATTGVGVQVVLQAPSSDPTPTASPSPSPTATPTPTNTPTPSPSPTPPLLANPQNPVSYGADPTGAADSGSAFQLAINTGDLDVPAGDFRIDTTVNVPTNRNIRCEAGSDLRYTYHSSDWEMFLWIGTSGGSVFNCHFRGLNYNVTTGKVWVNHKLDFLEIYSSSGSAGGGQHIANNDFNGVSGYVGAIHIDSPGSQPAPENVLVEYNTFENCEHYAIQLSAGLNNTFRQNILTDCNGYVESDTPDQQMSGNLADSNHSTFVYGTGYAQTDGQTGWTNFLTCGGSCSGNACNFSENTCSNNLIDGPQPSWLAETAVGGSQNDATYINNICTGGCSVH
jgi:hypothetical protein